MIIILPLYYSVCGSSSNSIGIFSYYVLLYDEQQQQTTTQHTDDDMTKKQPLGESPRENTRKTFICTWNSKG